MGNISKKPKLWNKSFVSVFFTNLFTANCFYILLAVMPLFVLEQLRLNEAYIGVVMGVFSVSGVIARLLGGYFVDTAGRYKIFIIALAVFLLCTFGYIFTASFAALVAVRLLHGIGWGLTSTASSTIAADVVPPSRRVEGLGYFGMTMNIGMALGPALGVLLLNYIAFNQLFMACSLLAFAAFLTGFAVKVPKFKKQSVKFTFSNLIEKNVLGIAFMLFFYGIAYGSIIGFVVVYGKQLGIANSGLFFMFFAVTMIIIRPIIGMRLDRSGPGNSLGYGFLLIIISMVMLNRTAGSAMFFFAALILGLGAGVVMPLLTAMAINLVSPGRRGAANATIFTAFDGGIGAGAVFFGKMASITSIGSMYIVSCMFIVIALAFYYLYGKNQYEKSTVPPINPVTANAE